MQLREAGDIVLVDVQLFERFAGAHVSRGCKCIHSKRQHFKVWQRLNNADFSQLSTPEVQMRNLLANKLCGTGIGERGLTAAGLFLPFEAKIEAIVGVSKSILISVVGEMCPGRLTLVLCRIDPFGAATPPSLVEVVETSTTTTRLVCRTGCLLRHHSSRWSFPTPLWHVQAMAGKRCADFLRKRSAVEV